MHVTVTISLCIPLFLFHTVILCTYSPVDGAVAKTVAALGSDGEAEVAVSHKRKKRKQQSSVAVEPKSKEAKVSTLLVKLMIECTVCILLERRWDLCLVCKGNPRVSGCTHVLQSYIVSDESCIIMCAVCVHAILRPILCH